jgi:hypothetical protein
MMTSRPDDEIIEKRAEAEGSVDDSDPTGAMLQSVSMPIRWTGTPAVLRKALATIVDRKVKTSARRAKALQRLINQLGRIDVQAGVHGMLVQFDRNHERRTRTATTDAVSKKLRRVQIQVAKRDTTGRLDKGS